MKLRIAAIGRIRSGPERILIDEYLDRARAQGRAVGLTGVSETEIDGRSLKDKGAESQALAKSLTGNEKVVLLDERGEALPSRKLARKIGAWRDDGAAETVFLIGGADGHDADALPRPDLTLAFGPAVWPHRLVRIMLAEQIYRAAAILAGAPYHRD